MPDSTSAFAIITPCFNEAHGMLDFLHQLEAAINSTNEAFTVIVVDDCSEDNTLSLLKGFQFTNTKHRLTILSLQFNVGHQAAIYQGLLYAAGLEVERVIIMDADGEDDPLAIPDLIKHSQFSIVEVKRGKREESFFFQAGYKIYKIIFRLITGKKMDFGNYCMIDRKVIERIPYTSFIHFPAYLLKQKVSRTSIQFNRKKRITGNSKMSGHSLLIHAFRSLIEFAEDLLMVFLKLFVVILVFLAVLLGYLLYSKFIAKTAILGWFSTVTIGLMNLAMISLGFFIIGILLLNLLHQQNNRHQRSIYRVIEKQ